MSNSTEFTNIPVLSVDEAIESLSSVYCAVIRSGASPKSCPSAMMWGAPGVGKSAATREIAAKIEKNTGKKVVVTDVRLLLFNPVDLRGIPTANEDKTLAVWLRPKIFDMDPSDGVVNILFLDELTAAPQSVQAAAYQITLDRVVGEHRLPDNCFVIAAGNRVTDKSVSFKMPKALANRLMHFEIEGSFESWRRWAVEKGINHKVAAFLSFRNDRLFGFDPSNDDLAFPTPRSWEMVSSLLDTLDGNVDKAYPMIAGLVGVTAAMEFRSYCRVHDDLPCVEDIFLGRNARVPRGADTLYALVSSMTAYAREHRYELEKIGNSLTYAMKLPPEFGMLLITNYKAISDGYAAILLTVPEYTDWIRKHGGK